MSKGASHTRQMFEFSQFGFAGNCDIYFNDEWVAENVNVCQMKQTSEFFFRSGDHNSLLAPGYAGTFRLKGLNNPGLKKDVEKTWLAKCKVEKVSKNADDNVQPCPIRDR